MWFWISIVTVVLAALITPYTSRMQATSLWLGRVLTKPEMESAAPAGIQSAINDGWPSWVALLASLLPIAGIGVGFLQAWWVPLISLSVYAVGTALTLRSSISPKTVDHYILLFVEHASRREADYSKHGDAMRADIAKKLAEALGEILEMHLGSGVLAPSIEVARSAPMSEPGYLIELDWGKRAGPGVAGSEGESSSRP